jgi:hypothetical protein
MGSTGMNARKLVWTLGALVVVGVMLAPVTGALGVSCGPPLPWVIGGGDDLERALCAPAAGDRAGLAVLVVIFTGIAGIIARNKFGEDPLTTPHRAAERLTERDRLRAFWETPPPGRPADGSTTPADRPGGHSTA